jgi:molybdopterin synthase catalytic subunit
MRIVVQAETFDLVAETTALYRSNPQVGAVATFLGLVRDINDDEMVATLTLEHYAGMTETALTRIVLDAFERWGLVDVTVIHRIGVLHPTDPIVFVAVAAAHRAEAFVACEFIVDFLKTRAPIWKKEASPEGERWVEARDSDNAAAGRWQYHID